MEQLHRILRQRKIFSNQRSRLTTLTESQSCKSEPCSCPLLPPPTEWSHWTRCSSQQICGGEGVQMRTRRVIKNTGSSCYLDHKTVARSCRNDPCPCPHVSTHWSRWTECSVSCGGGTQRRSRDAVLGFGASCFKHAAVQNKTCNRGACPDKCIWWEFTGGKVLKGIPPTGGGCFDDVKLLSSKAQKHSVGMGREHIEKINPVKSVCGGCILFTSLEGKVGMTFIF